MEMIVRHDELNTPVDSLCLANVMCATSKHLGPLPRAEGMSRGVEHR